MFKRLCRYLVHATRESRLILQQQYVLPLTTDLSVCLGQRQHFVCNAADERKTDLQSLLKSEFSYGDNEIVNIIKESAVCKPNIDDVLDSVTFLKKINVSAKDVERFPWILSISRSDLERKLELLKSVGIADNVFLPFLKIPMRTLRSFTLSAASAVPSVPKRIKYLCEELQLEAIDVTRRVMHYPFFLTMDFDKLHRILHMLKDSGVLSESIIRNIWIFKCSEKQLKDRLVQLKEANLPIKTWILKCPSNIFEAWVMKWNDKTAVFGSERDRIAYLANRLGCSREYVQWTIASKNPRILTINAPKLKQMLDLLFANGYKTEDICERPTVLSRCVKTIEKRIIQMKSYGVNIPYLKVLCSSEENYQKAVRKLSAENEKSKKTQADGSTT